MKISYAVARSLLRRGSSGALGTQSVCAPGYPFVSSLPYVADGAGRPVFLLSGLAEHTRNLLADPHASLLVTEGEGSLLERTRLTVLGPVEPVVLDEVSCARYLRYSPESADYLALGDFRFFRLEPQRARFIGGFGQMGWMDAAIPVATLDPAAEATVVESLARLAPVGVAVLGLDFEGLDVRMAGVRRRLEVPPTDGSVAALHDAAATLLLQTGEAPPAADQA